jgi:leucyl aminopeptidase
VDRLREAAGYAALQITKASRVVFALAESGDELRAVVEGALLGSHRVSKTGKPAEDPPPLWHSWDHSMTHDTTRILAAAEAVWRVRDLVTMPPNLLNPVSFVEHVTALATGSSLTIEVMDEKKLLAEGMGGITAVGKGSHNPPRLMILRHQPASPPATLRWWAKESPLTRVGFPSRLQTPWSA